MKRCREHLVSLVIGLAILAAISQPGQSQQLGSNSDCCTIVSQALDAIAHIKGDATRAEIEREFIQDGGIFSRDHTIYTYRRCPYIKIVITFSLDQTSNNFAAGSSRDVMNAISKPYLEYPIKD